jgi:hypothetical protein
MDEVYNRECTRIDANNSDLIPLVRHWSGIACNCNFGISLDQVRNSKVRFRRAEATRIVTEETARTRPDHETKNK